MSKLGYGVKWIDHYKYITYTTPDGQRFRDNRLLDEKYLKTKMEELFAYGYEQFKTDKSDRKDNRRNGRSLDRADTTEVYSADTQAVQQDSGILYDSWEQRCKKYGFDIRAADTSGFERYNGTDDKTVFERNSKYNGRQDELGRVFGKGQVIQADGEIEKATAQRDMPNEERFESQGFNTVEAQAEMGSGWGGVAVDALYLAADITTIGEADNDSKQKPKLSVNAKKDKRKKTATMMAVCR